MTLTLIDIDLFPAKIYLEYILHQKPPSSWCCETADITAEAINHISILEAAERSNKRLRFLLLRCSCPGVLADQGMGGWSCNQFCLRGLCATLCQPGSPWLAQSAAARPPAHMQHCVTKPPPLRLFSDFPTGVLCLQRFSCISCQIFTPQQC